MFHNPWLTSFSMTPDSEDREYWRKRNKAIHDAEMKPYRDARKLKNKAAKQSRKRNRKH